MITLNVYISLTLSFVCVRVRMSDGYIYKVPTMVIMVAVMT